LALHNSGAIVLASLPWTLGDICYLQTLAFALVDFLDLEIAICGNDDIALRKTLPGTVSQIVRPFCVIDSWFALSSTVISNPLPKAHTASEMRMLRE
jgi:hypothetical protein